MKSQIDWGNFRDIFEKELLEDIENVGKLVTVNAGEVIIDAGEYVKFIPIILSGSIKVIRQDDDGEILLYYVGSGDTCAMSLTCCLAHQKSRVKAIAEEDTTMISIPVDKMENWMVAYKTWNQFVMQTYNNRFNELLKAIDNISFKKVDQRLIKYLKDKASVNETRILTVNHQEIANELNSSREVISRLLKQLEKNGEVILGRNRIELLNPDNLS